jgi:phosphate transport system permease protein
LSRSVSRPFVWGLRICAWLAGGISLLILASVAADAYPVLHKIGILRFFTDRGWYPTEGLYNLVPMLSGTLAAMAGAVLLATPAGIASAVFCNFYAPKPMAAYYRMMVELLAGIPSVVYGFWGLVVLVPIIGAIRPPGPSLIAGILVLAIMILPTIALIADASLAGVPEDYLRAAAALGISRWGTLRGVVFPAAKSGLFTGTILETGRAIGETMAILMVCGNVVQTPTGLFQPIRTLTANIALEMPYAVGDHRSALFVSGLLLMIMIITLVACAEWFSRGKIYG